MAARSTSTTNRGKISFWMGLAALAVMAVPPFAAARQIVKGTVPTDEPVRMDSIGAVDDGPIMFIENPGVQMFSGQMIVRPLQADALFGTDRTLDLLAADARVQAARDYLLQNYNVIEYFPEVDEFIIEVPAGLDENQTSQAIMATGHYQYAEPNWMCAPVAIPNDPNYSSQWQHPKIKSPQAWDLVTGNPSISATVVDTGVDLTHPDLAANLLPGFNAASDLTQQQGGQVNDINGHGTFTAGCVMAIGNNGQRVAGVCWNIKMRPVRATNQSSGNASIGDLTQGARWAVDNGSRGISVSYSGVNSSSVQTTGNYVKTHGGLLFWAAGNDGVNLGSFDWADVIIVGASTTSDTRASFSNFGTPIDCVAPGVNVWSTTNGGGAGSGSGTSFSTPIANGVANLMWCANPTLTAPQVETFLLNNCDDLGSAGEDTTYGRGRVNAFKAVQAALGGGQVQSTVTFASQRFTGATGPVAMTLSPADVNNVSGGNTTFTATYNNATNVTITAPATISVGGVITSGFYSWRQGNTTVGTNPALTFNVQGATTYTAWYIDTYALTVNANIGAVAITVSPADRNGQSSGTTPLSRTYTTNQVVTLTAPATGPGGQTFKFWTTGSTIHPMGQTTLTVNMTANQTATANY